MERTKSILDLLKEAQKPLSAKRFGNSPNIGIALMISMQN